MFKLTFLTKCADLNIFTIKISKAVSSTYINRHVNRTEDVLYVETQLHVFFKPRY